MTTHRIIPGDCIEGLRTLPDASVHCCISSPPYWGLRDYNCDGQIGLESTPDAYVARMVEVFREVRRVLRDDGTCWLNLGDSYTGAANSGGANKNDGGPAVRVAGLPGKAGDGLKPKDLVGIPWRVAFALQADGWWLRQDIIWHKPNPMPESVRDRCTKAHEYVFLLTKSGRYFYDAEAVSEASKYPDDNRKSRQKPEDYKNQMGESGQIRAVINPSGARTYPTRNRRSVWTITTKPYRGAHFAVMPPDLVEPCIKAGTSEEGCCPVCGKGWERVVEKTVRPSCESLSPKTAAKVAAGLIGKRPGLNEPGWRKLPQSKSVTTGWQPACDCGGSPAPCTVLDPFAGSGTTLAVAAMLGRSGIGCELNAEYITLAEQRIREARQSNALFEGVPA